MPPKSYPVAIKTQDTLYNALFKAEAGKRAYNSYNRGSNRCDRRNPRPALPLTRMTFHTIDRLQRLKSCNPKRLFAVGMYQIIPTTLKRCRRKMGIPPSARYTRKLQDKIFAQCLARSDRRPLQRYIQTGRGIKAAGHSAAQQWAGLQSPILKRGAHDGKGGNKATVPYWRVIQILQKTRIHYLSLMKQGVPEKQAYALALGVKP